MSKKGNIFENTEMLFCMKCFSSGHAKAIHISIFSRNIMTFVSKHFFLNLKNYWSKKEKGLIIKGVNTLRT